MTDNRHPANADGLSSDDGAAGVSTLRASISDALWYGSLVDDAIDAFVAESNRIEGIRRTTLEHREAHWRFLRGAITVPAIVELVAHLQPDARYRFTVDIPDVRVGNHVAPPSGPDIDTELRSILAMRDPWEQHVAYETLHPFTDGNGRSGRAIWLHRHYHERGLDPWAIRRGFLHSWYYHTLSSVRLAKVMSASGQDPSGVCPDTPKESI